jgi:hypothetical protein
MSPKNKIIKGNLSKKRLSLPSQKIKSVVSINSPEKNFTKYVKPQYFFVVNLKKKQEMVVL